jgi:hypothetical protein
MVLALMTYKRVSAMLRSHINLMRLRLELRVEKNLINATSALAPIYVPKTFLRTFLSLITSTCLPISKVNFRHKK